MKKRVYGKKLSRGRGSRKALFRGLVRALAENGSIKTTKAKAKAVQGDIDRLVNMAKDGSVQKRRMLFAALGNDKRTTDKLVKVIAEKLPDTSSGYTRIIPLPQRRGDMAEMARLEWVVDTKEKKTKEIGKADDKEEGSKGVTEKLKSVAKRGKNKSKKKTKKSTKSKSSSSKKKTKKKTSTKKQKESKKKTTKKTKKS